MPYRSILTFLLPLSLLISGCNRTENQPGPGGVTVSEAKALDDAAAMLESRDDSPDPNDEQISGSAQTEPAR